MEKYFDINEGGYSIRCKLICSDIHCTERVVIFAHGFGGHKDTRAAATFANRMNSKYKKTALLIFDLPAHGKDALKHLTLSVCDEYLTLVTDYAVRQLGAKEIYGSGTSFGGFLILKYLLEHGNPFKKIVLRCPVVEMYSTMQGRFIDEEAARQLARGKDILVGFDRKVKIDGDFVNELKEWDLTKADFMDFADDIFIVHGTADEVVDFKITEKFAEDNVIELMAVEGADHRFTNPTKMDAAIAAMIEFMEL